MIVLNEVTKIFEDNFIALSNINLKINKGETVGIVGYSGAGKSTLVRLINGLITPTTGEVIVDGKNINKLNKKELNRMRHKVAMIFQSFNLLASLTVYQNIELALKIANIAKEDRRKRILEVIKLVGLEDKINDYPKTLSGGQKQRVGIARAIVNKPKILLCDEITSALDQKTAYEIIDVLKEIKKQTNVTICFISHQLDIVRQISDRVIVMDRAKIVEENTSKEIFIHPKHEATKSLVASLLEANISETKNVYRLIYSNKIVNETVLSDVIKKYDIDTNIIHAKSIEIKDEIIGYLWIQILGINKDKAILELTKQGIEVLYDSVWKKWTNTSN